jgi:hypothetical protein
MEEEIQHKGSLLSKESARTFSLIVTKLTLFVAHALKVQG